MANDLLKEAIADAKAVRETALANAKIALEEAFTPRLQSMLSAKLAEEEGMEDEPEMAAEPAMPEEPAMEEDYMEDEPAAEGLAFEEEAPEAPAPEPEPAPEEDLELEAIIAELESEMNEAEDKEEMDEVSSSTGVGNGEGQSPKYASSSDQDDPGKGKLKEAEDKEDMDEGKDDKEDMDEDISIDEIINALREEEGDDDKVEEAKHDDDDKVEETKDSKDDLEEAYNVIRFLKSKINEVNLLNAKLLFSNKLFKNHSMNESQKMKVIENFDRASSIREVKLVYATLSESLELSGRKTKRSIKESYASTPSRSTRPAKKVISEGTDLTARWKKLANL
jgi:hypothetical protein